MLISRILRHTPPANDKQVPEIPKIISMADRWNPQPVIPFINRAFSGPFLAIDEDLWVTAHHWNLLAFLKGKHRFVYLYRSSERDRLLERLQRDATDPQLTLSWFDLVVLREQIDEVSGPEGWSGTPWVD